MNKRIFILIVVLMSTALLGIIGVQVYLVNNTIHNKQQQFVNNVQIALAKTSEILNEREDEEAVREYAGFFKNEQLKTESEVKNFLFFQEDKSGSKRFVYGTFLEENYKIPTGFNVSDTVFVKKIKAKHNFRSLKLISDDKDLGKQYEQNQLSIYKRYTDLEKMQFKKIFSLRNKDLPIHERVNVATLNQILKNELEKRNITQQFKFGVYNHGIATRLKSGYFNLDTSTDYCYPIFYEDEGVNKYKIHVNFPDERKNIYAELSGVLILSIFFIIIIISAFVVSIYQLLRQKKISEIKTDFINNMTHEFKTPIATINLALDAIKNPKIIDDKDKVIRYVQMIKEENKRMHGQVESVLRISKLEKKQLDIKKESVDMALIIEEAIEHVSLLLEDSQGKILTSFGAISSKVLGNQFHLTNVIVNILENAIKYSDKEPLINVETESTHKFFIVKIKDNGIGMSKQAQKQVFEKFYREQKGNIHNVKGHGLGLAYVKEIVDNHFGTVYVESNKPKGSIFTVKIPLI